MRTSLLAALLAAALLAPGIATADPAQAADRALDFLAAQQRLDGSIGSPADSAWAAIAFARAGIDPSEVMLPNGQASLEGYVVAQTSPALLTNDLARQVLALVASGADARTAAGFDAVQELLGRFDGAQFGSPLLVNDDIFALQALAAAGIPASAPEVQAARAFVLGQQQPSGAWSFGVISIHNPNLLFAATFADVDTTAQAMVALLATGSAPTDAPLVRATLWMKGNQNLDGGCTWSPVNLAFGALDPAHLGQSNADSTSWAMMGVVAMGMDPASPTWTSPTGGHLEGFLLAMQQPDGGFAYQTNAPGFQPLSTTAFAVVALLGHTFVE
jgi:hypothetical protein